MKDLRRNQKVAIDPEFRRRITVAKSFEDYKFRPRGLTSQEWEYLQSQGWFERPR